MPPGPDQQNGVVDENNKGDDMNDLQLYQVDDVDGNNGNGYEDDYGNGNAKNKITEETNGSSRRAGPTLWSDEKGNLKFVNLVVRCPCCIFWLLLLLCFVLSFLLIGVVFSDGNPFSDPGTESDLDDVRSIQFDSLRLAQEDVEDIRENRASSASSIRRQSESADFTYWVFEGETPEGVFGSRAAIEAMKEAFDLFLVDENYKDYCLLVYPENNGNGNSTTDTEPYCDKPLTPLNFYYAAQWDSEEVARVLDILKTPGNIELFNQLALCYTRGLFCELVNQDEVSDEDIAWTLALDATLREITSHWDMTGELVQNFTQVTEFASYLMLVDVYKGQVDFGYDKEFSVENPISQYSRGIFLWGGPLDTSRTTTAEDKEDQEEEDDEARKDYIVDNFLDDMEELSEEGTHKEINSYFFMGVLILEVLLEIIARDGMLAIFSLVFVFIWLRINTRSWFLSGIGILEIFFSIPIAWFFFSAVFQIKYFAFLNALSIFIVAAIGADDIFIFMDAYNQSKYRHPDHLVSLETRMTWVYRRTGQAMAITSATTCAAFLCTLITPLVSIKSFGIFAAFVILIDYLLVMSLFCTAVVIYHDRFEDRGCFGCCCTTCSRTDPSPTEQAKEALERDGGNDEHVDRVGEFFRNRVAGFVKKPIIRAVLAVLFLGWIGVAVWQTSKLEATQTAEQFLDEDHPLQKSITIINTKFPTADDDAALRVYYAWGLGEVDRSGVNLLFDPEDSGKAVFLESFNFDEQCQTELVSACARLKSDAKYAGLIKREGGVGRALCFMEELAAYNVQGNLFDCEYVQKGLWKNETWQIAPENLPSVMEGFLRQLSCNDKTETISGFYSNELGWDGENMKYAAISVESEVLNPFSQEAEAVTRAEYDQFVLLAKELDETVSQACAGPVIMTDLEGIFVFMNNQAIYVRSALQSSLLGVAIAFTVLLFATRVLHIAIFASFSIVSVLVSVTGTMVLLGWTLGSIESILIGIIAGFSVDYVVHLAHAYESASGDTYERITAAFGDMGISVMNGMITSIAASLPLFFCQLQFFAKFGTFLCLTIAYSWIFANFGFMSLLAQLKIPIKNEGFRL